MQIKTPVKNHTAIQYNDFITDDNGSCIYKLVKTSSTFNVPVETCVFCYEARGMDSKVHRVHASPSPFLSPPAQTWKSYQLISGNQKNICYLFCL